MKKLFIVMLLIGLSNAILAEEPSFNFTTGVFSDYVWRGQRAVDGGVSQTSITAKWENLALTGWGNLDLTNKNDQSGNITEINGILDYSNELSDGVGYSLGLIVYDFPHSDAPITTEIYAGLNFDVFLKPSIAIYRDIDEVDGTYASVGIEHTFENGCLPLTISSLVGWGDNDYNSAYWDKDKNNFNDFVLSLSTLIEVNDWKITPSISYISLIGEKVRDSKSFGEDSDFIVVGINFSLDF